MGDALEAALNAGLNAWESRTLQQEPVLLAARTALRALQAKARKVQRRERAQGRRLCTTRQRQTGAWIAALTDADHLRVFVAMVTRRSGDSCSAAEVDAETALAASVLPGPLLACGLHTPDLLPAHAAAALTDAKRWVAELLTYLWVSERNRQGVAPTSAGLYAEYGQHLLGHGRTEAVRAHEAGLSTPAQQANWARNWRQRWECTFGRLKVQADLPEEQIRRKASRFEKKERDLTRESAFSLFPGVFLRSLGAYMSGARRHLFRGRKMGFKSGP